MTMNRMLKPSGPPPRGRAMLGTADRGVIANKGEDPIPAPGKYGGMEMPPGDTIRDETDPEMDLTPEQLPQMHAPPAGYHRSQGIMPMQGADSGNRMVASAEGTDHYGHPQSEDDKAYEGQGGGDPDDTAGDPSAQMDDNAVEQEIKELRDSVKKSGRPPISPDEENWLRDGYKRNGRGWDPGYEDEYPGEGKWGPDSKLQGDHHSNYQDRHPDGRFKSFTSQLGKLQKSMGGRS